MYQKSNVREGNIRKSGALGGENSLTGAWTGAGAGVKKKNTPPRAVDRGGAGN